MEKDVTPGSAWVEGSWLVVLIVIILFATFGL